MMVDKEGKYLKMEGLLGRSFVGREEMGWMGRL